LQFDGQPHNCQEMRYCKLMIQWHLDRITGLAGIG
jgi:hypothetical protein